MSLEVSAAFKENTIENMILVHRSSTEWTQKDPACGAKSSN